MTERGMIFNAPMIRALLDGSKTQTRRIMKVQPESEEFESRFILDSTTRNEIGKWCWTEPGVFVNPRRSALFSCPFGAVGDRLWVREAHSIRVEPSEYSTGAAWYRESDIGRQWEGDIRWKPSIHMPRWASRITLEITDVRVERLNSISDEDARAEGYPGERAVDGGSFDPWLWFRNLWDGIYPEQSFKHNPWVWVIEFRRVEGGAA